MAGPTVSALAGISGLRSGTFAALATLSVVFRLIVMVGFAEWLREYLEIVLAFIDEHWLPGTILMVAGVAIYRWRRQEPAAFTRD